MGSGVKTAAGVGKPGDGEAPGPAGSGAAPLQELRNMLKSRKIDSDCAVCFIGRRKGE